jgi:hypothetical protein
VTATQIIEAIKRLGPEEQVGVIRFAYQLDAERQLTGNELASLAKRMVNAGDPAEQARIREQIIRGFYGGLQTFRGTGVQSGVDLSSSAALLDAMES